MDKRLKSTAFSARPAHGLKLNLTMMLGLRNGLFFGVLSEEESFNLGVLSSPLANPKLMDLLKSMFRFIPRRGSGDDNSSSIISSIIITYSSSGSGRAVADDAPCGRLDEVRKPRRARQQNCCRLHQQPMQTDTQARGPSPDKSSRNGLKPDGRQHYPSQMTQNHNGVGSWWQQAWLWCETLLSAPSPQLSCSWSCKKQKNVAMQHI